MREGLWIFLGLVGQSFFGLRFLVQWIMSERANRSIIPEIFWYFSFTGAVLVLIYAIHRKDPVFIVGQGLGILIYSRNLILMKKHRETLPD
jgi:lipid-A-disaccharide synthase-like uncharacterized protein